MWLTPAWRVDGAVYTSDFDHYDALMQGIGVLSDKRGISYKQASTLVDSAQVPHDHGYMCEGRFYTDNEWSYRIEKHTKGGNLSAN